MLALLLCVPVAAPAQEGAPPPLARDVALQVLLDPTTYAPAVVSYAAMSADWKTSQVLFAHGWVEANPRFTRSGRPNDVPVPFPEGQAKIRRVSLKLVAYSGLNNAGAAVVERLLVERYPSRRKLIRTLSWIERIAYASVLTYRNSADHFRQAGANRRLARELGYAGP